VERRLREITDGGIPSGVAGNIPASFFELAGPESPLNGGNLCALIFRAMNSSTGAEIPEET